MVALVVLVIAVVGLLRNLDGFIDGSAYLRDRSQAQVVAQNRLAELRLALHSGRDDLRGNAAGMETMLGRDWFWRLDTTATSVPGLSRVEIGVSLREGEDVPRLYTLVALLPGLDAPRGS